MNSTSNIELECDFTVSDADFASDWSIEGPYGEQEQQTVQENIAQEQTAPDLELELGLDDFPSQGFWTSDAAISPPIDTTPVAVTVQHDLPPIISDAELNAAHFFSSSPPPYQAPDLNPGAFIGSSPPPQQVPEFNEEESNLSEEVLTLNSQELDELVNDPEWGFEDSATNIEPAIAEKIPQNLPHLEPVNDCSSSLQDVVFDTSTPPVKNTNCTQEKAHILTSSQILQVPSSIIDWSQSPDYHKTETMHSRRRKLAQRIESEASGTKRRPVSQEKTPVKSAKICSPPPSSSPEVICLPTPRPLPLQETKVMKNENLKPPKLTAGTGGAAIKSRSPSLVLGKDPSTSIQSKLTSFISPLIKKAHASTLAADMKTSMETSRMNSNAPIAPIFLTEEQRQILSMVVDEGRNIFFTGAAGTGKSVLLRRIISELRGKYRRKGTQAVAITASTGLAACNIGGMTLHSFGGIGLGEDPVSRLVDKIRKNRKAHQRWKSTKVLVIDEISMIDGGLFDKLEEISRIINKNDMPFGGIQLVITGDFFQLPPVFKAHKAPSAFEAPGGGFELKGSLMDEPPTEGRFSFEAHSWNSVVTTTVELKQVFRQKDNRFSSMLNSIRAGTVTDEIEKAFQSLSRTPKVPEGITPTELFPMRKDVDNANRLKMLRLAGSEVQFLAQDMYASEYAERDGKLELLMCPKKLKVKRGAQVMLIKNMDETLVNGSLGKVMGFMNDKSFKLIKELPQEKANKVIKGELSAEDAAEEFIADLKKKESAEDNYEFDDIEFDKLIMLEESRLAENPQNDMAESSYDMEATSDSKKKTVSGRLGSRRASSKISLVTDNEDDDDAFGIKHVPEHLIEDDPDGVNWQRKKSLIKLMQKADTTMSRKWPYVRFLLNDGTTRDVLVQPETWTLEDREGRTEASRSQVPLILAWALSIHKSQGQTLEWVKVDLTRIFEKGQAYVALSRAVRMEGLHVLGFTRDKIMVHPKVINFYAGLVSAPDLKKLEKQKAAEAELEEEEHEVVKSNVRRVRSRRKLAG